MGCGSVGGAGAWPMCLRPELTPVYRKQSSFFHGENVGQLSPELSYKAWKTHSYLKELQGPGPLSLNIEFKAGSPFRL